MIKTHGFSTISESESEIPELGEKVNASPQWQEVSVRIGYRNTAVLQQGATPVTSETPLFELSVFVNGPHAHAPGPTLLNEVSPCLTSRCRRPATRLTGRGYAYIRDENE